jgi:hypothetical protein
VCQATQVRFLRIGGKVNSKVLTSMILTFA